MGEFFSEHKKQAVAAAIVLILAVILVWKFTGSKDSSQEGIAYVETVGNLTGQNASLGMINRFAGVIEAQGTWSVSKNSDVDVKEIFVSAGDTVEEGQALFEYDTTKYEDDLNQAQIELERLGNECDSARETIAELEKEKRDASSSEQANYTVQIKEQNLALKDKQLDIQIKEAEINKLENNIENSVVKSEIGGVVKTINDGSSSDSDDNSSFITVMKLGTYRVKGIVNEQNIGELCEGAYVLVHSRVNERIWKGTVSKIDTENAVKSDNIYSSSESSGSTKYPFYVELESSDGLIMGQHVYVELDMGQEDEDSSGGIWLGSYMVDQTDPEHPFVWIDRGGKLQKQEVTIGESREEIGKVKITEGLTLEDSICIPDSTLTVGMKTAPMSEKPDETQISDETGEGEAVVVEEGDYETEDSTEAEEGDFSEEGLDMEGDAGGEETIEIEQAGGAQ